MTAPKFQHYVPRFYLARFVDRKGFVWVFDKTQGRTFRLKPETIAGQNRFYDLPELEKSGGARTLMEHQFADLESEAQKISECWLRQAKERGHVEIPEPNREIMSLFLTLQLLRTAEARTVLVQFVQLLQRTGGGKKRGRESFLDGKAAPGIEAASCRDVLAMPAVD